MNNNTRTNIRLLLLALVLATTISANSVWAAGACRVLTSESRISDIGLRSRLPFTEKQVQSERQNTPSEIAGAIAQEAPAGFAKQIIVAVKKRLMGGAIFDIIRNIVTDYSGTTITTTTYAGRHGTIDSEIPLSLTMGRRLGFGMHGGVYEVANITFDGTSHSGQGLVVKVPHRVKGWRRPMTAPENGNREEVSVFKLITEWMPSAISKVEASPNYPKNPAWSRGTLPIIPILTSFTTVGMGTAMVKPLVRGWGLKEIFQRYGKDLPPEMLADLKGIYEMSVSVNSNLGPLIEKGIKDQLLDGRRNALDANPRNLVWIPADQVQNLRNVGVQINREGFYLIEFALRPSAGIGEKTWEQYLANFYNDLKAFGENGLE